MRTGGAGRATRSGPGPARLAPPRPSSLVGATPPAPWLRPVPRTRTASSPASRPLVKETSLRRPGAATWSPARKTPSPRMTEGRSRQVVPGRSTAPVRPSASASVRQVVRSRQPGKPRSRSSPARAVPSAFRPSGPTGNWPWRSCSPAGASPGSWAVNRSSQPGASRSETTNASPRRVRSARSTRTVRPLSQVRDASSSRTRAAGSEVATTTGPVRASSPSVRASTRAPVSTATPRPRAWPARRSTSRAQPPTG